MPRYHMDGECLEVLLNLVHVSVIESKKPTGMNRPWCGACANIIQSVQLTQTFVILIDVNPIFVLWLYILIFEMEHI